MNHTHSAWRKAQNTEKLEENFEYPPAITIFLLHYLLVLAAKNVADYT
jgi:hypothetical protein